MDLLSSRPAMNTWVWGSGKYLTSKEEMESDRRWHFVHSYGLSINTELLGSTYTWIYIYTHICAYIFIYTHKRTHTHTNKSLKVPATNILDIHVLSAKCTKKSLKINECHQYKMINKVYFYSLNNSSKSWFNTSKPRKRIEFL